MSVPRADATIGQRLKKLEEDFRRIKLMPLTTQAAVAPATVKGAVWIDSSAGNEPKVWDGTAWVPVRDETIAVAQTAADTAQATVDPLIPLTDLAGATTGLVVTGVTNVTTDPGSGAHAVLNDPAYPGELALFSGNANEVDPGRVKPVLGGANHGKLELRSPDLVGGGQYCFIEMNGYDDGATSMNWQADDIEVVTTGAHRLTGNPLELGDGTDFINVNGFDLSASGGMSVTAPTLELTSDVTINGDDAAIAGPYAYCILNGNHSTAGGAFSNITNWQAEVTANGIVLGSGTTLTVPRAGRYKVTVQLAYPTTVTAGSIWADVRKNGAVTPAFTAVNTFNTTHSPSVGGSKTLTLAANDTLQVRSFKSQAGAVNIVTSPELTFFQLEWVGP